MAAAALAILVLHAPPARAEAPGRVVVVTLDGTYFADWQRPETPALGRMLDAGAVALLSTRTAAIEAAMPAMRREAYRALGSGRFASQTDPTELVRTLEAAGVATAVIASDLPGASSLAGIPAAMPDREDASFPTGRRTDYAAAQRVVESALARSRVLVIDPGDTARVEGTVGSDPTARAAWMRLSLSRADTFVAWLAAKLAPNDTLIVASLTPTMDRQRLRIYLAGVAMTGGGTPAGTLTTPTTERDGVVTLADLAPTILRRAGVDPPKAMTGRPMVAVEAAKAIARVAAPGLESDLLHASLVRGRLMRGAVFAAGALTALALLTILSSRGAGGSPRGLPETWRGGVETGLVAVTAFPLALYAEPLLRVRGPTLTSLAVAGVAVAVGVTARAILGSRDAIVAVCAGTASLVAVDLLAGGPLAMRSPLSYLIAEGARFHGMGNEVMGVLIGCVAIVGAAVLDRGPDPRTRRAVPVGLAVAVAVMAAPQLGAKFGSIPAAVPAFGLLALYALRVRITLRSVVAIAILTVLVADLAIVADSLRHPDVQSHVARALGGGGEIAGRKAGAAGRLLSVSFWAVGVAVCGGSIGLLLWRRPSLVARGLWGEPAIRRTLAACAVAAAAAVLTNDAGVIAAAWLAMLAAASFFSRLLLPREE